MLSPCILWCRFAVHIRVNRCEGYKADEKGPKRLASLEIVILCSWPLRRPSLSAYYPTEEMFSPQEERNGSRRLCASCSELQPALQSTYLGHTGLLEVPFWNLRKP